MLAQTLSLDLVEISLSKFKLNNNDNCIAENVKMEQVLNFFGANKVSFRYVFIPKQNYGSLIILEYIRFIHQAISSVIEHFLILGGLKNPIGTGRSNKLME